MDKYRFHLFKGYACWSRVQSGKPKRQCRKPQVDVNPLEARARRVHNTIKKQLMRLIPQPLWFVTVTMPDEPHFKMLTPATPTETNSLLALLKRAYREDFPDGYLFWDIEFYYTRGVHVHFGCYPGEQIDQEDVKNWFRNIWCRTCDDYASDIVDVAIFNRHKGNNFHANYLTKRSKIYCRMLLLDCFGTNNTFGIVGRENVNMEKPRSLVLSEEQKVYLIDVVIGHSLGKIHKMKRSWEFVGVDTSEMVDNELKQIEQVKCGYGLHYLDDELHGKLNFALDENV